MVNTSYGQLWCIYAFKNDETGADKIGAQVPNAIIFTGEFLGKGIAFRWGLTAATNALNTASTV